MIGRKDVGIGSAPMMSPGIVRFSIVIIGWRLIEVIVLDANAYGILEQVHE